MFRIKSDILVLILSLFVLATVIIFSIKYNVYVVDDISMIPTYESGDKIVAKKIDRTDLVNRTIIFYNPFSDYTSEINQNPKSLLIKRCVAGPGDSIMIKSGTIINSHHVIDTHATQNKPSLKKEPWFYSPITNCLEEKDDDILNMSWVYIPKKGDKISLSDKNYKLYSKIIEYENRQGNQTKKGIHIFDNNYYFLCGDNLNHSFDSRVWGFVPEKFLLYYR